ncbi:MAG TPA: SHOCT domain-containing protein [Saprospiraceae bacterium]|nr:SHOCT domain-containing protein [Saprospiraceae bacterium]
MTYKFNKKITYSGDNENVLNFIIENSKSVSDSQRLSEGMAAVVGYVPTFGSINRYDRTEFNISKSDNSIVLNASLKYVTTFWFWLFFIIGAFTYIGWIIPVIIYFYHRGLVTKQVEKIIQNTYEHFNSTNPIVIKSEDNDQVESKLEKLFDLKNKGIITEEEFLTRKSKLLS